jgi:hypothetical protein
MFLCNHCPYVKHLRTKIAGVAQHYQQQGIAFIAINSNDAVSYPADSPEKMREEVENFHYTFPYLFDETQNIAKAYHAACTPDFYVFNENLACVYRGRFDGATPGNSVEITGEDLTRALENILQGEKVNAEQKPSVGCNIKWKK